MSGTEEQTPIPSVTCPNCGRENAPERLFCQFCRHRITSRLPGALDLNGQPAQSAVAEQLQASLQAAQNENQNLQQQLQTVREELDKDKARGAMPEFSSGTVEGSPTKLTSASDTAVSSEPQSVGWETKWKSVEEKAKSLEEQAVSNAKAFEADLQKKSGGLPLPVQGTTHPDSDAAQLEVKPAVSGPAKTMALGRIKNLPVVAWVVVLNGAQRGEDFRLLEGKNTMGSAAASTITLSDPAVSAEHASINYKDGRFVITDLDSTNGTFMNDDSEPLARVDLRDNDVIRVGETSLKFKCL